MENSIEKLKKAVYAIYFLDGAKGPADDCSSLLKWAVTEIEQLISERNQLKTLLEVEQMKLRLLTLKPRQE